MSNGLNLCHDLVHILSDLQQAHVQARVLLLVLVNEALEVLVHRVEEGVHLLEARFRQRLDLADTFINHSSKLLPFIRILLRRQVELVEENLAHLDDLLVAKLKVLVRNRHAEITINEICQPIHILIVYNRRQLSGAHLLAHASSDTWEPSRRVAWRASLRAWDGRSRHLEIVLRGLVHLLR